MSARDPSNLDPADLVAYADGELAGARRDDVARRLADPAAAARVAAEARFRGELAKKLAQATPAPSSALRKRIAALVVGEEGTAPASNGQPGPLPLRMTGADDDATTPSAPAMRRLPTRNPSFWAGSGWKAVAACLLVGGGALVGRMSVGRPPQQVVVPPAAQSPVSPSFILAATKIHVDCSRAPDAHTAIFPEVLGELASTLKASLGRPVPYPDLSAVGYDYIGAGPCGAQWPGTVHLLYRHTQGGAVRDTVSLFVQADSGDVRIEPGKLYQAAGKEAAHPLLVWRRDKLVFYLVGDAEKPLLQAAATLGETPL